MPASMGLILYFYSVLTTSPNSKIIKYGRRKFIRKLTGFAAVFGSGLIMNKLSAMKISGISENSGDSVCLPRPIQVVIDDVGWWSGWDGSAVQEPFRTGMNRDHVLADYKAIIELGRALGIRPQAAMVLCEWDRENILRDLPESTWMGTGWDNGKWVGPWLDEAADLIRSNPRHFEFTVHGIGHEHWSEGKLTRAEWSDKDGTMRPTDHINRHLDYYERLMRQNGLETFHVLLFPPLLTMVLEKPGKTMSAWRSY